MLLLQGPMISKKPLRKHMGKVSMSHPAQKVPKGDKVLFSVLLPDIRFWSDLI